MQELYQESEADSFLEKEPSTTDERIVANLRALGWSQRTLSDDRVADYVVKRFFQEALRVNRGEDPKRAGEKKKAYEMPQESVHEASAKQYVKVF